MNDNGLAFAQGQFDKQEPPEGEPALLCDECHHGIYWGDKYYIMDGTYRCESCMQDCLTDWERWAK